jgi:Zn-dependent peptidase ImmA (M78 family)
LVISRQVKRLLRRFKTRCPFQLAELLHITIVYKELPAHVKGYCMRVLRRKYIILNINLPAEELNFICAHELGHLILHKGFNHFFITQHTLVPIGKIEREANQFAVELLISDKLLLEGATIYEAAAICGVPEEAAILKQMPNNSFWTDESSYYNL